jgi:hypothetical protein
VRRRCGKDFGKMMISNLGGDLCFVEDVSKLRCTRYQVVSSVVGVSHLVDLGGQNENIV